jgi:hypothetical protein
MRYVYVTFGLFVALIAVAQIAVGRSPISVSPQGMPLSGGTLTGAVSTTSSFTATAPGSIGASDNTRFLLGSDGDYWWEADNTNVALWSNDSDGGGTDAALITFTNGGTTLKLAPYTYEISLSAGAANFGPTAPTWVDSAAIEYAGLAFDADAETVHFVFDVPSCWIGAGASGDMTVQIFWTNESGVALADTETVKWDLTWRTKSAGEDLNNGSATSATVTYTQSGAGTDGELFQSNITIDHDAAGNAIAEDDLLGVEFSRDMTGDTYASDAVVLMWHIDLTADDLCFHE